MKNPFNFSANAKQDEATSKSFELEIFQAGKRTDMSGNISDITVDDLQQIAANYDASKHEAPLVIGHPSTDTPAYGWVKSLAVQGNSLIATVAEISQEFLVWIKQGQYKKISSSFWKPDATENPTPNSHALKHVGFLGGAVPAVKGMRQASFAAQVDGVVSFESLKDDGEAVASLTAKMKRMEAVTFAEKAIREGRMLPLFKESVVSFMTTIGQAGTVSFADNSGERSLDAVDWFKEYVEKQPKIISFGAVDMRDAVNLETEPRGLNYPTGYAVDREGAEQFNKVTAHAKAKSLSFADALRDLSGQI